MTSIFVPKQSNHKWVFYLTTWYVVFLMTSLCHSYHEISSVYHPCQFVSLIHIARSNNNTRIQVPSALRGGGGGGGKNKTSNSEKRRKRAKIKRKRESDPLQTFSYSVEQLEKSQVSKKPKAKVIVRQENAGRSMAGRRKWKEQHEKHLTRKRRRKKKRRS